MRRIIINTQQKKNNENYENTKCKNDNNISDNVMIATINNNKNESNKNTHATEKKR